MKKMLFAFAIVFVCGVITADLSINKLLAPEIIIDSEYLKEYATSAIVFHDVIWNLVYERLKLFLVLLLLRVTPMKRYISFVLIMILLFCLGFFVMSCVLEIGFVGVLIGIASVFPHGLLYLGGYLLLSRESTSYSYRKKALIPQKVMNYILAVMFFVTGCVIECVMGVNFVPWLIRLSMI